MAGIKLGEFRGVRPRMSARLLDPREGQRAINVRLGSGELRPLRGFTQFANWAKAGAITSMYPYDHPTRGRLWLHWVDDVDVAAGPNVNDENQRIYYTGDGLPKMTFDDLVAVGEGATGDPAPGQFPRDWRYLGVPPPPSLDADEDLQFTPPNLGGTLTNFTAAVEFENLVPQSNWNGLPYTPQSITWLSLASPTSPTPEFEIDFTPGDEFVVEVVNTTTVRISAFGRDYLTPSTKNIKDIPESWSGTLLELIYGNYMTAPEPDGTYGQYENAALVDKGIGFSNLRPQNRATITFPGPHGLNSGEILRITAAPTVPRATGAALFTNLSGGTNQEPAFWKSETQLTWNGEVEYEVVREGVGTASGTIEDRAYVYTYVSDLGEEGPPSEPTRTVTVSTSNGVLLSGFALPVLSKREITHIRVYRSDSNETNAEFRFVTEIAIADIEGWTPPVVDDTVYGGTVTATSTPVVLGYVGATTVNLPAALVTAATAVDLQIRIYDEGYAEQVGSPPSMDTPVWSVQFQSSLDNVDWTNVGAAFNISGIVTRNIEPDVIPGPLHWAQLGFAPIPESRTFDASLLTLGDDVYFRALVTYVSGAGFAPRVLLFSASEPVVAPVPVFTPVNEYTFLDELLSFELGEVLPSDTWFPPPDNMHSLVTMPNGMLAGAYGNTVVFCEPYRPHAWPPEYEQSIDYTVVGLGVFGNSLLVCTTGTPYVMTGTHPRNVSMRRIEVNQACVSKNSIANVGVGVLYATPDGLGFASQQGFKLITDEHFDRDTWQALNPATMVGFSHDERYICFFTPPVGGTEGAFVFDPMRPDTGLSFVSSTGIRGGFNDLLSDTLFLTNGAARLSWDTGSAMTYTWRSKAVGMPYAINPAASRVLASAYPITFRLYGDGVLRHERAVANREAFRLPGGYLANEFEVELVGVGDLRNVWVGETMREVLEG